MKCEMCHKQAAGNCVKCKRAGCAEHVGLRFTMIEDEGERIPLFVRSVCDACFADLCRELGISVGSARRR